LVGPRAGGLCDAPSARRASHDENGQVDYPGVLPEVAAAEKGAPNDVEIYHLRGKAHIAMNRHQDAVAALKRAIELAPLNPNPYHQLGLTYRKLGQTELACQILDCMQHLNGAGTP